MSYNSPMLIKDPDLRWPIVLLAASITAAIAMLIAVMHFVALTKSPVIRPTPPRVEWMLQPGQPDFNSIARSLFEQKISDVRVF